MCILRLYITQVGVSRKVKKTNVPVTELVYGGMLAEELQKAVEKEFEMALQDRVMEETKDKKNAVEAYVYDMRNKVDMLSKLSCLLVILSKNNILICRCMTNILTF